MAAKTISNVPLQAGVQILRFEINTDHQSEIGNWLFSLNYIKVNIAGTVDVSDNDYIPSSYSLSQNYPNPFNPTTNFKFSIPQAEFVNLTIYDAMGRVVETLHNGELTPGTYEANWNASNYPSGVYFYKLSSADFNQTKKMILLK